MLFAFVYNLLRLLLDVAEVRLRVRDPEAELLLPNPRRVAQARSRGFRNCYPQVAAPEPDRSGAAEIATELEDVLESSGFGDRAHRFPEC
jgi:hypothetical protein